VLYEYRRIFGYLHYKRLLLAPVYTFDVYAVDESDTISNSCDFREVVSNR